MARKFASTLKYRIENSQLFSMSIDQSKAISDSLDSFVPPINDPSDQIMENGPMGSLKVSTCMDC